VNFIIRSKFLKELTAGLSVYEGITFSIHVDIHGQATGLVIGCHEDLWGEVEPQFVHLEKVLIGRFHLPHFDTEPTQVLRMAMPIFTEAQKTRVAAVLSGTRKSGRQRSQEDRAWHSLLKFPIRHSH
jgi:hypothetical protein